MPKAKNMQGAKGLPIATRHAVKVCIKESPITEKNDREIKPAVTFARYGERLPKSMLVISGANTKSPSPKHVAENNVSAIDFMKFSLVSARFLFAKLFEMLGKTATAIP